MAFWVFKKVYPDPPTGYVFTDPDTGYKFKGHKDLNTLYEAVKTYRENNNLEPIVDLRYAIEDYICTLPANIKKGCCRKVEKLNAISYSQFVAGGKFLLSSKIKRMFGFKNQTEEHSKVEERRGKCVKCPFNVVIDSSDNGYALRSGIKELMKSEFPDIATKHDEEVGICGVCNCPIEYKSCLSDKEIAKSLRELPRSNRDQFPSGGNSDLNSDGDSFVCWQKSAYLKHFNDKGQIR